jgi:hypothetical protein
LLAFLIWLGIEHRRRSIALAALAWVAGGALGVVALMLGYFWSRGALKDLIYFNVLWPYHNYGQAFSVHYASFISDYFSHWVVPMRGINWTVGMAAVLVIPFLFMAAIPVVVVCLGAWHGIRKMDPEIALYWLAGSALWLSEIHRKDISHLVFGAPLLVILCVYYLQDARQRLAKLALQALYLPSICLAAATLIVALFAYPTATRVGQVGMAAYDPVLAAIDDHVPPGGELFIYPYGAMYYFLSATTNPTPYAVVYYNFKIGPRSVFDDVVWKLEQRKVRYVLWDRSVQAKLQILFPMSGLRQHIIETYLESHYKPIWSHGGTFLMERTNGDHDY